MLKDLKLAQEKVEYLLKKYPETRDSDKLLWLAYLCHFCGLKDSLGLESYLKMKEIVLNKQTPVMESISRARRKIQESGLYQGKNRVYRLEEKEKVRAYFQ